MILCGRDSEMVKGLRKGREGLQDGSKVGNKRRLFLAYLWSKNICKQGWKCAKACECLVLPCHFTLIAYNMWRELEHHWNSETKVKISLKKQQVDFAETFSKMFVGLQVCMDCLLRVFSKMFVEVCMDCLRGTSWTGYSLHKYQERGFKYQCYIITWVLEMN